MRVGAFRRMLAFIIDLCVFLVASNALAIFYPRVRDFSDAVHIFLAIALFSLVSLVPMMTSDLNQTVGMKMMRMAIENKTDLPKWYFLIRHYFYWLIFAIFFIFIVFSRDRVTMYDRMAGAKYYLIPKNQLETSPA
jgi:hypothetical protein